MYVIPTIKLRINMKTIMLRYLIFIVLPVNCIFGFFEPGFYIGFDGSIDYLHQKVTGGFDMTTQIPDGPTSTSDSLYEQPQHDKLQYSIGIFAGYLSVLGQKESLWRLAPEVSLRINPSQNYFLVHHDLDRMEDRFSVPWSLALKMKIGRIMGEEKDYFIYGFLGTSFNCVQWNRYDNGMILGREKRNTMGFLVGLGIEKELRWGHRIGIEITQNFYKHIGFKHKQEQHRTIYDCTAECIGDTPFIDYHPHDMSTYTTNQTHIKMQSQSLTLRYIIPF